MYHYRKTRKIYKSFPKPIQCDFCNFHTSGTERVVEETDHALVVKNRVFYDLWEMREVTEHLMVIPKRHVRSLGDLNDAERLDIMKVIGRYENNNYNVYARAKESTARSVAHQHTHLIKISNKRSKILFYIRKPYMLIKW
jgi:diadenosine tetraphosphate (Ap4A) HIT family hydrolase